VADSSPTAPRTAASGAPPATVTPLPTANVDEILEEFRVPPETLHQDVKRGCFLYFAAAFGFLGLFLVALYFLIGRR